jgi:hypothetical protein
MGGEAGNVTVRIAIDLNVRVKQDFPGVEPGTVTRARASKADGPVTAGDKVTVWADDIIGDAEVVGERMIGDPPYRVVYLAVDWKSFRDDPEAADDPACE